MVVLHALNKFFYLIFLSAGRILEADECPLEVQSQWETGDQGTFTLTQAEFEVIIVNSYKSSSKLSICQREMFCCKRGTTKIILSLMDGVLCTI